MKAVMFIAAAAAALLLATAAEGSSRNPLAAPAPAPKPAPVPGRTAALAVTTTAATTPAGTTPASKPASTTGTTPAAAAEVLKGPKGEIKVGTAGTRPRAPGAKPPASGSKAARIESRDSSCYAVGRREYCDAYTQAMCCEGLDYKDNTWIACETADGRYTCDADINFGSSTDKVYPVCCD